MKHLKLFENFDESQNDEYYQNGPNDVDSVINNWFEKTDDSFFTEFIEVYPTRGDFNKSFIDNYLINDIEDEDISGLSDDDILDSYWNPESEVYMLEQEFPNFPGQDLWVDFFNDLINAGW
jgi:hypothetical protein